MGFFEFSLHRSCIVKTLGIFGFFVRNKWPLPDVFCKNEGFPDDGKEINFILLVSFKLLIPSVIVNRDKVR